MAPRPPELFVSARGAALLEARREDLNQRFARAGGTLSPQAMLGYMRRTMLPILDAWEREPSDALLIALFDLGLAGFGAGLVGERDATLFEMGLVLGMVKLEGHVAAAPGLVLRAIGNGYTRLAREVSTDAADGWLAQLASGAGRCPDRGALFDLGGVLAWRAGLAEARDFALERAAHLDPELLRGLFGATELEVAPHHRFCAPGRIAPLASLGPLELITSVGGFTGFGGSFRRPPLPRVVAGRLVCTDGDATFELHADVFGARLRPAAWAHEAALRSSELGGARVDASGSVQALGSSLDSAELRGAIAAAEADGVVAVALVDSHKLLVLGRREARA